MASYKYQYGIKEVELYSRQYSDSSVYVSKPFAIDGSIISISMESDETQPSVKNSAGLYVCPTSVEYYITAAESPTNNDWLPILPKSQLSVINERLFFSGQSATLRFPCDLSQAVAVYNNGVPVNPDLYDIVLQSSGISTITMVPAVSVDPRQYHYTIDYFPDYDHYDAWNVTVDQLATHGNIQQSLRSQTDSFAGTDEHGVVYLSKIPYVNTASYSTFNNINPISVSLSNANFPGSNRTIITNANPYMGSVTPGAAYTRNITQYSMPDWETRPYTISSFSATANPYFDYYQSARMIYFGETFSNDDQYDDASINHGNADISVTYQYLITNIRVKIILRQNPIYGNSFSPQVSSYSLNVKFSN